jgi:hypothetical protein
MSDPKSYPFTNVHLGQVYFLCYKKIKEITETLAFVYHSANNHTLINLNPIEVDCFPHVIYGWNEDSDIELTKAKAVDWIYKKAFEDLISGVNDSLVEACIYVQLYKLSLNKNKRIINQEQLDQEIKKIREQTLKLYFPDLIEKIESGCKIRLTYGMVTLTMNKIRRILVHRNGVVTQVDLDKKKEYLELQYGELVYMVEENGKSRILKKDEVTSVKTKDLKLMIKPNV